MSINPHVLSGIIILLYLQGDQVHMAVEVYTYTVNYTGQVTLYKVPEKHGHV